MAPGRNVNTFSLKQVKTIVERSPDCENITDEGLHLIAAATKRFLVYLTAQAYKRSCTEALDYKHLSECIAEDPKFNFLREMVPKKITVRDLKQLLYEKGMLYEFPPDEVNEHLDSQEKAIPLTINSGPSTSYASNSQQEYVSNFTDKPTTSYAAREESDTLPDSTNSLSPSPSYSSLSSEVRSPVIMYGASDDSESES